MTNTIDLSTITPGKWQLCFAVGRRPRLVGDDGCGGYLSICLRGPADATTLDVNGISDEDPNENIIVILPIPPLDFSVCGEMDREGWMALFSGKNETVIYSKEYGFTNEDADTWAPASEYITINGKHYRPEALEALKEYEVE